MIVVCFFLIFCKYILVALPRLSFEVQQSMIIYMKQRVYKLLLYQYFAFTLVENQIKQRLSWSSKTHTAKFPYGETSVRRTYFTAKFPCGKISVRRNFQRRNFLTAEFPYGKTSHGEISSRQYLHLPLHIG